MASLDFKNEKAKFKEFYNNKHSALSSAENSFCSLLDQLLTGHDKFPKPKIVSRLKDRDECISKFGRKYRTKLEANETPYTIREHITDIIGLRVICLYETDIIQVEQVLRENFKVIDVSDKTSSLREKNDTFGYKGVHLDLALKGSRIELPEYKNFVDFQFEVQIRSIVQDAWSEIDHKLKYKKSLPSALKRRIYTLAALFELADREFVAIKNETESIKKEALEKDNAVGNNDKTDELNVFGFLRVAMDRFDNYSFESHKAEGFVEEIKEMKPGISESGFKEILDMHLEEIREYKKYQENELGNDLNPFTQIRHALYQSDSDRFNEALFDGIKKNFERWVKNGSAYPTE